MPIPIGVSFDGFSSFADSLKMAREAEDAGASSLWMAEHLGYRDALGSCMAFAMATQRVSVVPTAISPYLRNPMPLAMAMATLAEAAPGRVRIALGIGNPLFLGESGVRIDKPVRALREYLEALRGLWTGDSVRQLDALLHPLNGARMMFIPPEPIPIYLAPMKEQNLRLAGAAADGVVLSAGLSPAYARVSLDFVAAGARAIDRDPNIVGQAAYIFFIAARNTRDAMEKSRRKLAFVLRNRFLDESIAHSNIPIDQAAIIDAIGKRDLETAARLVPDDAVEAFTVFGTSKQCADRLQKYIDAGIGEPVLLLVGDAPDHAASLAVIREFN